VKLLKIAPLQKKVIVWKNGDAPFQCDATFCANELLIPNQLNGTALIYLIEQSGNQYCLGDWIFNGNVGRKSKALEDADVDQSLVEPSALKRLHLLLQNDETIEVELKIGSNVINGKIAPLSITTEASFFTLKIEQSLGIGSICENSIAIVRVNKMSYSFKVHVIDEDLENFAFAIALPKVVSRILRRHIPRSDKSIAISVSIGNAYIPIKVLNFSPTGLCLSREEVIRSLGKLDEVKIRFTCEGRNTIDSCALIVGVSTDRLHLTLSGIEQSVKEKFFLLFRESVEQFEMVEDPETSWKCLEDNGYLGLINDAKLYELKEAAITAWKELEKSPSFFMPSILEAGKTVAIGTIGIAKVSDQEWIPHSLATKVDPRYIGASSSLYCSWPYYLLSQQTPLWVSTWYNANKPWHNRFYQVFLTENKNSRECFSFVRRHYLFRDSERLEGLLSDTDNLIEVSASEVEKFYAQKYKLNLASPIMFERNSGLRNGPVEKKWFVFYEKEKPIFYIRTIFSKLCINPLGMFNILHVDSTPNDYSRGFDEGVKQLLLRTKFRNTLPFSLTIDFNKELKTEGFNGECFDLGESRCLSTSARYLPALISNNSLSFKDMEVRKRVG